MNTSTVKHLAVGTEAAAVLAAGPARWPDTHLRGRCHMANVLANSTAQGRSAATACKASGYRT
jgi:hypothetical protein